MIDLVELEINGNFYSGNFSNTYFFHDDNYKGFSTIFSFLFLFFVCSCIPAIRSNCIPFYFSFIDFSIHFFLCYFAFMLYGKHGRWSNFSTLNAICNLLFISNIRRYEKWSIKKVRMREKICFYNQSYTVAIN